MNRFWLSSSILTFRRSLPFRFRLDFFPEDGPESLPELSVMELPAVELPEPDVSEVSECFFRL